MNSKSKEKALAQAIRSNHRVIWKDRDDNWQTAKDRKNAPSYAAEIHDVDIVIDNLIKSISKLEG